MRWLPGSDTCFASVDYDGAVCVWDVRATAGPVARTEAHEGKSLCLEWALSTGKGAAGTAGSSIRLLSGGSDCCVASTAFHGAAV